MERNKSVFGVYPAGIDAESAVAAFKNAGFSTSDISVLLPKNFESTELITDNCTKAPESTAIGAGSGAAVGGALGWFLGVGALVIPGIGPVIAAGPIVAVLAGVGIGGALGGFAGSLIGVGMSEDEAKKYEGRLRKGGILIAVQCQTSAGIKRAEEIMKSAGAEDVAASGDLAQDGKTAA